VLASRVVLPSVSPGSDMADNAKGPFGALNCCDE
jgi:hypothetical protein